MKGEFSAGGCAYNTLVRHSWHTESVREMAHTPASDKGRGESYHLFTMVRPASIIGQDGRKCGTREQPIVSVEVAAELDT